jgi:hypothetical protein
VLTIAQEEVMFKTQLLTVVEALNLKSNISCIKEPGKSIKRLKRCSETISGGEARRKQRPRKL